MQKAMVKHCHERKSSRLPQSEKPLLQSKTIQNCLSDVVVMET